MLSHTHTRAATLCAELRVVKTQLERANDPTDAIAALHAAGGGTRIQRGSTRHVFAPQIAQQPRSGGSGSLDSAAPSTGREGRAGSKTGDSPLLAQTRSFRALSTASSLAVGRSRRVVSGSSQPAATSAPVDNTPLEGAGVEMVTNPIGGFQVTGTDI